jgi:PhzF family phenazine biosynthesis protein
VIAMDVIIYKISSFTLNGSGGNKAGVVLEADGLTSKDMLRIANNVGYSETAFVMNSKIANFKVRFFTPLSEVDLCGHATIAVFNLLQQKEIINLGIYTQETKAGVLRLDIREDAVYMEQKSPRYYEELTIEDIKNCFNNEIITVIGQPIQILSTGVKEIFLPVNTLNDLNNLDPNLKMIKEISKKYDVIGIHAFTTDGDVDAYSRNFAPIVGIDEESATGTSNGALSCYLYKYVNKKNKYILRQGFSMGLPSEIKSELKVVEDEIIDVFVGGKAKII